MINKKLKKSYKSPKKNKTNTTKNQRIKKIIQGGGYYKENDYQQQQNNNISINGNLLIIIICILLFIIGLLVYYNINKNNIPNIDNEINNELLNEANLLKKYKSKTTNNKKITENYNDLTDAHPQYNLGHRLVTLDADNPNSIPIMPSILNHNLERIINPLLPPERSYVNTYGIPTNIPSRGFSGGYQQIGTLHKTNITDTDSLPGNNNKSVILPIYGQPTYPGSNKWNYYTTSDKNTMVKMTFKVNGKMSDDRHGVNELMTDDQVQIPEYNGDFSVKKYQFDQPKYIPLVY